MSSDLNADIGRVLTDAADALDAAQNGISAFPRGAADNADGFANTAHWMANKFGEDIDRAAELVEAACDAHRAATVLIPIERQAEQTNAAVDRLRALAARDDKRMPFIVEQEAIDSAVADAIYVLCRAQRWGQLAPVMQGLARAGMLKGSDAC